MNRLALLITSSGWTQDDEIPLSDLGASPITSRGLSGELLSPAVIAAVTVATIGALERLVIACIGRHTPCTIKFSGIEVTARNHEEARDLLNMVNAQLRLPGYKSEDGSA